MRGVKLEGNFTRTQLNTNPTRVRTTIASVGTNKWEVDDRGHGEQALTNGNYLVGQFVVLQSRQGLHVLVPRKARWAVVLRKASMAM